MRWRLIRIGIAVGLLLVAGLLFIFVYPRVWGDVLYPLDYKNEIALNADEFALERNFVAAVIREESGFDPRAVSSAGARGLMQLMPTTARAQASRIGLSDFTLNQLYDPAINIRLGVSYLRSQLDFCGGTKEAALVAYNAGCTLARKYADTKDLEGVPRVTKAYIKEVLSSEDVYNQLYGKQWVQEEPPKVFEPPQDDDGAFWRSLNPLNFIRNLF